MNRIMIWPYWQVRASTSFRRSAVVAPLIASITLLGNIGMAQAQNPVLDELKRGAEKALRDTMRTTPSSAPGAGEGTPQGSARSLPPPSLPAETTSPPTNDEQTAQTGNLDQPNSTADERNLKLGESWNGISFTRIRDDAVVMAGGKAVIKCIDGASFTGTKKAFLPGELDSVRLFVSKSSPKKGLVVVGCGDQDRGASTAQFIDARSGRRIAHAYCYGAEGIGVEAWSPKEDYAIVGMYGEGGGGSQWGIVNLNSGKTKCVNKPHHGDASAEIGDFRWRSSDIADYRANGCMNDGGPYDRNRCKVIYTYVTTLNVATGKISPKKLVAGAKARDTSGK